MKINSEKGKVEKKVTVNIYNDDDYYSIALRFLKKFGDDGLIDGYFLLAEERNREAKDEKK